MASLNKVYIIGYLGNHPQLQYTKDGIPVCRLRVATDGSYINRMGENIKKTEWHRVNTFKKIAESCHINLSKGSLVYIEGRLETQKWKDKYGNERYTTDIYATSVTFLDKAPKTDESADVGIPFIEQQYKKIDEHNMQQHREISDVDYVFGIDDTLENTSSVDVPLMDKTPF